MTAYVGDRRLYGWGVYAATHFDILVEVVLKLLPDSTLLGSNHGRLVWNLTGFRESGSVSRRTDSGTEQCAPAFDSDSDSKESASFYSFGMPNSALGKPMHLSSFIPSESYRLRVDTPPSKQVCAEY
jgi:hypothetical protein